MDRARAEAGPGGVAGTRIYGKDPVSLAKRAGQRRGWTTEVFDLYGKPTRKRYKTFLATWRPAGGVIRVVLVEEPTGWVAFFCTDPNATVADILGSGRPVLARDMFLVLNSAEEMLMDRKSK